MIGPSHVDLLATSRHLLYVAITTADPTALTDTAERLRAELLAHFDAERPELADLPPRAVAAAGRGQQAALALLDALIDDLSERGDAIDVCACLGRVAEVQAALRRQARLESLVLRRQRRRRARGVRDAASEAVPAVDTAADPSTAIAEAEQSRTGARGGSRR